MCRNLCVCLAVWACYPMVMAPTVVAEDGVHWIWEDTARAPGTSVEFERKIAPTGLVSSVTLRCQADFCEATVTLNGTRIVRTDPYDWSLPVDVLRHWRTAGNVVVVGARAIGKSAAVAVEILITRRDGTTQRIASDGSWQVRVGGVTKHAKSFGRADVEAWWNIPTRPSTNAFDEYNQWRDALAKNQQNGRNRAAISVPPGFEVQLLRQSSKDEGSWISLTIDAKGRLILGRESAGLLRLTVTEEGADARSEVINKDLRGCHGLLWAHGALYANASDSRALYRLRDTTGDDRFDDVQLLKQTPGGTGDHGRNDLALADNGQLFVIHGDAVETSDSFTSRVPITRGFGSARRPLAGYLARTDRDGKQWEIYAAGLRNPYGVAINVDGELFTYDADSERHVGLPYYRPTRMNHLVSGADYGWRRDIPWPTYHADSLPPNVLIGRGSPTGVKFGTKSHFPRDYRRAMFALDWAYGRVFTVHVIPRGGSYSMHPELFMRGRPLNAVDLDFAEDGSMYLLTGGYRTRSSLYRVRYVGPAADPRALTAQEIARNGEAQQLRTLRRELEAYHQVGGREVVEKVFPYLSHSDRWIRHAARVALEHQPVAQWRKEALSAADPHRALAALLALVRVDNEPDMLAVRRHLASISLMDLHADWKLTGVRIAQWMADTDPEPSDQAVGWVREQFEPLFPSGDRALDRELAALLAIHGSEHVVGKTLGLISAEPPQIDKLHYLWVLAEANAGWTESRRTEFFRILAGARFFLGDEQMPKQVQRLIDTALANTPQASRKALSQLIAPVEEEPAPPNRPVVRAWTLTELDVPVPQSHQLSLERGARLYREASCSQCHRAGTVGRTVGPDLTTVSARFSRRELLESIVAPSKVVSSRYQNHVVVTEQGKVITGQVVWNGFRKSLIRIAPDPLRLDKTVEISKHDIVSQEPSPVSPMPKGLLNTLTREEIFDLLAFIEAGGAS